MRKTPSGSVGTPRAGQRGDASISAGSRRDRRSLRSGAAPHPNGIYQTARRWERRWPHRAPISVPIPATHRLAWMTAP